MEFLDINEIKRLESFGQCYSQSLQLQDFKDNHALSGFKNSYKKIHETRKVEYIHE